MAVISFIYVHDLNRFLSYLKEFGIDVDEYGHIVFPDSSEYVMFLCRKNGRMIAYMAVHYIDTHYAALVNLSEDASDREIIEALINAEKSGIWRVPVEPIIYIANDKFTRILNRYSDDFPENTLVYVNQYKGETTFLRNLISNMIDLAKYLDQDVARDNTEVFTPL